MDRLVTQLGCIVDNCAWNYTEPDPAQHLDGRGRTIEDMVERALSAHAEALDAVVREHLDSHSVLEWSRTVAGLREIRNRARQVASGEVRVSVDGDDQSRVDIATAEFILSEHWKV
jgi:hypothetical protein